MTGRCYLMYDKSVEMLILNFERRALAEVTRTLVSESSKVALNGIIQCRSDEEFLYFRNENS